MKRSRVPFARLRYAVILFEILFGSAIATGSLADVVETREEINEQARAIRNLWLSFQDQIAGLRIRFHENALVGARYEDTDLHWFRTGLSIDGALPILNMDRGIATSFSTALLTPDANGSTNIVNLPGTTDDPFDPFLDSSFRLGAQGNVGHGFSVALTTGLTARHEVGADLKSALAVGGSLSVDYRRGTWFRLRLGVGLGSGIDRAKLTFSPVFRLRLQPISGVWIETDATSGRIDWEASSDLTLSLFGGVDSKRFRLDKRPGAFGAGSLEFRKSKVGVGLQTRPGRNVRLRFELALVLGQHISLLDENRKTIDALDTREPSAALRLSFEWRAPYPSSSNGSVSQSPSGP